MRLPAALALLAGLLLLLAAPARAADDVLQTYRKRYTKDAFLSEREQVLQELVQAGSPEAREAIVWCLARSREFLDAAQKESDKRAAKVKPFQEEFDELLRKYVEAELAKGNPYPTTKPVWPVDDKLNRARADLLEAEKIAVSERTLRDAAVEAHGKCVDRMPQPKQDAYRDALLKGPLQAKEWAVRAEQFELLRSAQAPWVLQVLLAAGADEPDPRALAPALDALAGRESAAVVPVLVKRLDDARWLVRAAALSALERTPSKEAIDAIVARAPKEEGRLRDDCLRILKALTGADVAKSPEAWRQWWEANREGWKGPPPPAPKNPTADQMAKEAGKDAGKTGFFGIETSSRRLCYVIDISGSMLEKAFDKGKETRAETAKAELARAIRALEDGSQFSLVMFASDVRVWKTDLVVASAETKKEACAWVEAAPVVGATNTYGALEAAFKIGEPLKAKPADPYADPKLDTIILLSDGKPTNGRTTRPDEIRAAVRDWNKRRRVTVHAIAFGKDADFDFLEGLAKDTGGQFTSL